MAPSDDTGVTSGGRRRRRRRKVCLFGISADPPTGDGGHRGIAAHLATMMEDIITEDPRDGSPPPSFMFDEVRVLPVYSHMFGSKRGRQAPYEDRVAMCRLNFANVGGEGGGRWGTKEGGEETATIVTVSEAERECYESASAGMSEDEKSSLRIGTAALLDYLRSSEPDVDFAFAMGADAFVDLASGRWRRVDDVFESVDNRMVVFRRMAAATGGGGAGEIDEKVLDESVRRRNDDGGGGRIITVRISSLTDVSSSMARSLAPDEGELSKLVTADVLEYVTRRGIYGFSSSCA